MPRAGRLQRRRGIGYRQFMRSGFSLVVAMLLAAPLAACSDERGNVLEALPDNALAGAARDDVPESRMEAPLARPVTIGEDGPRLDACGATGVVRRLGEAKALPLRAAPFADARSLADLPEGTRLHVCTRSLDQKWLGVVVARDVAAARAPADATAGNAEDGPAPIPDCGVSSPVERRRAYDGPCPSGWVSSAYVVLVAG
jgi:hypothetical protein